MELARVSLAIYDIFGDYYRRSKKLPWRLVDGLKKLLECAQNGNPEAMYALSRILVNDIYDNGWKEWLIDLDSISEANLATYWAFKACLYCKEKDYASVIFRNAISFLMEWENYGEAKYLYEMYVKKYGMLYIDGLKDKEAEAFDLEEFVAFIKEEIGDEFETLIQEVLKKAQDLQDKREV